MLDPLICMNRLNRPGLEHVVVSEDALSTIDMCTYTHRDRMLELMC